MNKFSLLASFLVMIVFSAASMAQHEMHNMEESSGVLGASLPEDNAVLASSPESITLHFEQNVRLVKLVVKEAEQGFIDIGFRYKDVMGVHYEQAIPPLSEAEFYTVEWAVLDAMGMLIKGRFYFSFGEDAMPPSYYLDQMEHPQHIMSPDYRLL